MKLCDHEDVVLVDEQDQKVGLAEKLFAHQEGLLHRAFSVFLFRFNKTNNRIELMLQQRHKNKYHSGMLWSNTCCSHPRDNETIVAAGIRRLKEEMGITLNQLENLGYFIYKAALENSLVEHELDYVLVGVFEGEKNDFTPNPKEIMDWRWLDLDLFEKDLENNPYKYSIWLSRAYAIVKRKFNLVERALNISSTVEV